MRRSDSDIGPVTAGTVCIWVTPIVIVSEHGDGIVYTHFSFEKIINGRVPAEGSIICESTEGALGPRT